MNSVILQVFYAIFSGFIEVIAIPNEFLPLGSPLIALFSLVPLYIALYRAKSYKEAFLLMFLQTLTVHLGSSFWLANFRDFASLTLGASAIGTAFEAGLVGIVFYMYPSHFCKVKKMQEQSGTLHFEVFKRMLWFTSIWVFWEWFKSTGFLAYPWGTLFLAAYNWKVFTQISDVTGVWGVTFLYAIFSALVAEVLFAKRIVLEQKKYFLQYKQAFTFVLALFALSGIYGAIKYIEPRIPEKYLAAVIVQQNCDPWEGGETKSLEVSKRLTEQQIINMREKGIEPDLVIWSEGVLKRAFPNARFYYYDVPEDEGLSYFIKRMQVPFIIGGETLVDQDKRLYSNSAILFDSKGTYSGFYSKIHLVPFAEAIPFADNVLVKLLLKKVIGFSEGLTSGNQYTLFKIPIGSRRYARAPLRQNLKPTSIIQLDENGIVNTLEREQYIASSEPDPKGFVSFTTPICFEDAFADVCSALYNTGSEIFINITNDAWSNTKSAEYQHFAVASYLALEFRTTLVRCANAGYTVVVDPAGRVLQDLPLFKEASLGTQIPIYKRTNTYYSKHGNWFAHLNIFCIVFYALYSLYNLYFSSKVIKFFNNTFTITIKPLGSKE